GPLGRRQAGVHVGDDLLPGGQRRVGGGWGGRRGRGGRRLLQGQRLHIADRRRGVQGGGLVAAGGGALAGAGGRRVPPRGGVGRVGVGQGERLILRPGRGPGQAVRPLDERLPLQEGADQGGAVGALPDVPADAGRVGGRQAPEQQQLDVGGLGADGA